MVSVLGQMVLCPDVLTAWTVYLLAPRAGSQFTVVMEVSQSVVASTKVGTQGAARDKCVIKPKSTKLC